MTLKPWIEHDKRAAKFVVRWRDAHGKKHRDTYSWDKVTEARKRLELLLRQNQNQALGNCKELAFKDAAEIFMRLHGPRLSNDQTRRNYTSQIAQLNKDLGEKLLSRINYQDLAAYWEKQVVAGLKRPTIRRRVTLVHNIYARFKFWNGMVPDVLAEKIALPDLNPAAVAMEYLGNKKTSTYNCNRKRRVSEEELRTAKAWCLKNEPELWEAIKLAIWTALRKSDMKRLKAGSIDLVQEKTGQQQIMPITLKAAPNFGDISYRWNLLRGAMGWLKKDTPLHTTWHDLRHCAPSMLADEGFSVPVISQYLGHSDEKMARTYTHPSGSALIPAVKFIEQKLEAL